MWKAPSLPDDGQNFVLADDEMLSEVQLDVAAAVLGEQHPVAHLHVELAQRSVLEDLAIADRDHLPLERLFLGRVGDDDAARGFFLLFQTSNHHAVLKWANVVHGEPSASGKMGLASSL